MKRRLIIYILLFLSGALASCSKFDELNSNPNTSLNLDPETMLTTVEYLPGSNFQDQDRYFEYPGGWMALWSGEWTMVEYGGNAQKSASDMARLWDKYYPDLITKLVALEAATQDDTAKVNIHAMSRILKVQAFLKLTDYYGDIPYFEAGKGYIGGNLTPKYDQQQDIYNDFFKELDEAANELDNNKPLAQHDLFYNGDVAKWKKYANSLRLRIAMRLVKADPAKARQEAEAAVKGGVFTSNEDIAAVYYEDVRNPGTGQGKGNGVSNIIYGTNDDRGCEFWLTTEMVEVMEKMNDPRLLNGYYATIQLRDADRTDITDMVLAKRKGGYAASSMQAQKYEWDINDKYPGSDITINYNGKDMTIEYIYSLLRASKYIQGFNAPFIYISYAETEFLQAEASFRGWDIPGTPSEHYKNGLEAAVKQWTLFGATVPDADVAAFTRANPLTPGKELDDINTQVWVLDILDPVEAWSNYRRTGLPDITFHTYNPSLNQSDGQMPRRIEYPTQETQLNAAHYKEAISRIGSDDWLKRVWWDKP